MGLILGLINFGLLGGGTLSYISPSSSEMKSKFINIFTNSNNTQIISPDGKNINLASNNYDERSGSDQNITSNCQQTTGQALAGR